MAEKKEKALDLFWALGQLDRKNHNLWNELNEEQRKEFSPYMMTRWLGGCADPEQIVKLGTMATACVFELGAHKELMLGVLCACTDGISKRYKWVPYKGESKKASKALQLVATHYKQPLRHAVDTLKLLTTDDLLELAEAHGWQKEEIKELQKELSK
jgi:hypothetical protein